MQNDQTRHLLHALELPFKISNRELQVCELLAAGWSSAQMAEALGISVRTVGFHLASVYGKLGVHNRCQLLACLSQYGLHLLPTDPPKPTVRINPTVTETNEE